MGGRKEVVYEEIDLAESLAELGWQYKENPSYQYKDLTEESQLLFNKL